MKKKNKKYNDNSSLKNINNKILELKKEIVLLKIKQKSKQQVKPHMIKQIKYKISNILRLEKKK